MKTWKYVFAQIGRGWWIILSGAALVALVGLWEGARHPSIAGYLLFLFVCFCVGSLAGMLVVKLIKHYRAWRGRVRKRHVAAYLQTALQHMNKMPTLADVESTLSNLNGGDDDTTQL